MRLHVALLFGAAAGMGPIDPPFDKTRVLFSSAFTDAMVLQRQPQQAAVFGSGTPGASITVTLTGPAGYAYTAPPTTVASSADSALDATWKVLLPPRPAGFNYTITAACVGCSNATSAVLADVGFGDVYICSGQSNMECPVLTTTAKYETYNQTAAGKYDHIRLFQMGWRYLGPRNTTTWVLPEVCAPGRSTVCPNNTETPSSAGGYAFRRWLLPRAAHSQSDDDGGNDAGHFPDRFSAVCWYFGKSLSDGMAAAAAPGADPVPIGLVASTIGGTTIQQWLPPTATGNDTCTENNCGWVEQGKQPNPTTCANASLANVWSCPSGVCSTLWRSQIAPFVNMTISGAIWYQGEQNVLYGRGSATSGYQCQQAALVRSWRQLFSATPGTSAPDFPFGVVTLAGGASEGGETWSPYQHVPLATWTACQSAGGHSTFCQEVVKDWTAGLRLAQTGGYGTAPNPALPNVFVGQNYDQGEPCGCDVKAPAPGGCWASNACFGSGPYSRNLSHNYQNSGIHPRVKHIVGERLARGLLGLRAGAPQPTPRLAGCRLAGGSLTLAFDAAQMGAEGVALRPPLWAPAFIPLEFQVAPTNASATGWVYAAALAVVNATAVVATLPPGAGAPTAVRYAWGDYACCPGMNASTFFCPPTSCPIVTSASTEPAVPFWAAIVGGKCACDAPWDCSA